MKKILVWDLPVRLGHWLMVGGFALAWATGDSESLRLVHVFAGSTVMAVAAYRLLWGIVGSRHARFADFVRGPRKAVGYLKSLLQARPPHYAGHNPAAGLAIVRSASRTPHELSRSASQGALRNGTASSRAARKGSRGLSARAGHGGTK